MPDYTVRDWRGLDGRRQEVSSLAGVLSKCINAHLNRGGEIEKRYALVSTYSLPSTVGGTYGLASDSDSLYVFGSVTAAQLSMPAGVTYQRLAHPTPSTAMTALLDWSLFNGQIYATARFADNSVRHFYNGTLVTDIFDGKARGSFEVLAGSNSTVANVINTITVNGVDVLGGAKTFNTTSISAFAESIAAQITSTVSSPEYSGVANGNAVVIVSSASGSTQNGYVVGVTYGGNLSIGNYSNMSGGQDNPPGDPGTTVLTLGDKEYTVASKNINFSATRDATKFNQTYDGAGFVTPAMHSSGAATPVALGTFVNPQGSAGQTLLVLCREAIQVWHVEADDENNEMLQVIEDAGTRAGNANIGFGPLHTFLNHNGICGITKATDASNTAEVAEIGAPINGELNTYLDTLTQDQRDAAVVAIEPKDKRLWFAVGTRVYVLSNFKESQVSGWSRYDLDFTISDMATLNRALYCRSGNTIYKYGGSDGKTYDACTVTVRIANVDAGKPAGFKTLQAADYALTGVWNVATTNNASADNQLATIGNLTGTTFNDPIVPLNGHEANIAIEMVHQKTEGAVLSQIVLHYQYDLSPEG